MIGRGFWFLAGAAASTFVMVKGREYYRRLTPEGMAEQIERNATRAFWRTHNTDRIHKTPHMNAICRAARLLSATADRTVTPPPKAKRRRSDIRDLISD